MFHILDFLDLKQQVMNFAKPENNLHLSSSGEKSQGNIIR